MILVKDLIEWAKQNAIGRSASYPDGAIRSLDLLRLATDCYGAEPLTYNPQNGLRRFLNLGQEVQDGPIITPCRGCSDYDGYGGCKSKGGCARAKMEAQE